MLCFVLHFGTCKNVFCNQHWSYEHPRRLPMSFILDKIKRSFLAPHFLVICVFKYIFNEMSLTMLQLLYYSNLNSVVF